MTDEIASARYVRLTPTRRNGVAERLRHKRRVVLEIVPVVSDG